LASGYGTEKEFKDILEWITTNWRKTFDSKGNA